MAWPAEALRTRWPLALLSLALAGGWLLLFYMDAHMRDMAAMGMAMPETARWSLKDWLLVFGAWALMMAAMMVPASWPLVQLLRRYGRNTLLPLLAGYLSMWTLFSVGATVAQWALTQSPWFDPLQQRLSAGGGALLMLAAAAYQLTPYKRACLHHCQSPFTLLMTRWRAGMAGTFRLGIYHGKYCIGCCWVLMLVLFAVGAMNAYWAALLALATAVERLTPPPWPGRVIAGLLGAGALVLWW